MGKIILLIIIIMVIIIGIGLLLLFAVFALKLDQLFFGKIIKDLAAKEKFFVNEMTGEYMVITYRTNRRIQNDPNVAVQMTAPSIYKVIGTKKVDKLDQNGNPVLDANGVKIKDTLYVGENYETNSLYDNQPNTSFIDEFLSERYKVRFRGWPGFTETFTYQLRRGKLENSGSDSKIVPKNEIVNTIPSTTMYAFEFKNVLIREELDVYDPIDPRIIISKSETIGCLFLVNITVELMNVEIPITRLIPAGNFQNKLGSHIEEQIKRYAADPKHSFKTLVEDVRLTTGNTNDSDFGKAIMFEPGTTVPHQELLELTALKITSVDLVKFANEEESGMQTEKNNFERAKLKARTRKEEGKGEGDYIKQIADAKAEAMDTVYAKASTPALQELYKAELAHDAIINTQVQALGAGALVSLTGQTNNNQTQNP